MKSFILLDNVEMFACHGVYEQETKVGNVFIINLKVEVDFTESGKTDKLGDTVSYADLFTTIKQEMQIPAKLLEHVAYRIVQRLRCEYPLIKSIELKLSKRNPPIGKGAQMDSASVLLID